ncbi:MAG: ComF family protein [Oscillospiraceae bacterium]|nr:ComF family protein [Oscillospiraceae bacterium]
MERIVCGFCGRRREESYMAFKGFGICKGCAAELPYSDGDGIFEANPPLDYVAAPFYYRDIIKKTLHEYKFYDKYAYADVFAGFIAEYLEKQPQLLKFDFACPVPLSKMRMLERGYNQSELIARKVCERTGTRYADLLVRTRETKRQSGLSAVERAENIRDVFECVGYAGGMRILLFDDIYTHGFTAGAAAEALIKGGAKSVFAVAAAIVK